MSGIYIHIPFCKQACHYCDFHFSTNTKHMEAMVDALQTELVMRKDELGQAEIKTIYFGGGTPSILSMQDLDRLIDTVFKYYRVTTDPEITLEANPDDLSKNKIKELSHSSVNRLSIGVQSFFEEDLELMNRAHNAAEARNCLELASGSFDNISLDLIYGIPGMDMKRWEENLQTATSFNIPHISSYALTVEPRTALKHMIDKGQVAAVSDEAAEEHFRFMVSYLEQKGFVHYELSNFGMPGYFSENNTAYWLGKYYLGIGPSAHSYDGRRRGWNIRNNITYIKSIGRGELPVSFEELSARDRYNEYVMTGLRTIWGVSLEKVASEFGSLYRDYLEEQAKKLLDLDLVKVKERTLHVTGKGKFLTDGIAADLFMINLKDNS
ncbi:radical SAM family heme chaperone HemW [Zeaxanthinibacter enoshimensis]|uniref:Heme chaperone HemW n=1 Tax=Zeaxanthinibacter enoshimensis TaxID=392009 RepID=A0A4R6TMT3_9FLAO|nr:radical SAM family heme chaperone HemW [Zeaxanthinibacter enoshimensis]TDQ32370.1 oxygen-independent coproporphyrinogen-3 oxidase [Zeaxanthinibacter enoshimensis]